MKMWGGRFDDEMDDQAWVMNASIDVDRRMASQDVRVSLAWVRALQEAGVLDADQHQTMTDALQVVLHEIEIGAFYQHIMGISSRRINMAMGNGVRPVN